MPEICRSFFEMLKAYLKVNSLETFTNAEIRKALRINPSNQKRYMLQLQLADLVEKTKGNKRKGYVYQVTDYNDYETTNKQIETVLNNTIEQLVVQRSS